MTVAASAAVPQTPYRRRPDHCRFASAPAAVVALLAPILPAAAYGRVALLATLYTLLIAISDFGLDWSNTAALAQSPISDRPSLVTSQLKTTFLVLAAGCASTAALRIIGLAPAPARFRGHGCGWRDGSFCDGHFAAARKACVATKGGNSSCAREVYLDSSHSPRYSLLPTRLLSTRLDVLPRRSA